MKFEKPFPHFVMDFFPPGLHRVVKEWPVNGKWTAYEGRKRGYSNFAAMPEAIQGIVSLGMSGGFMAYLLEGKLEIPNLISDDTLRGAGLHETLRGGRLGMHVDFNQHPETGLYRRANAILYLNENWSISDGGALILSSGDESKVIPPTLGMFVAWEVGDDRWHGHPDPLEVESRKSIAWYFYTVEKPPGFSEKHGTIYR